MSMKKPKTPKKPSDQTRQLTDRQLTQVVGGLEQWYEQFYPA